MEKRIAKRIPVSLEFHSCNIDYFGTITDLSEIGIFIRSEKITFPFNKEFQISIPLNGNIFSLSVKVTRLVKINGYYNGIGGKILESSPSYLEQVNLLKLEFEAGSD